MLKKLLRNIVKSEDLDAKKFSPQLIMFHIDQWKNKGLLPQDVKLEKSGLIVKSKFNELPIGILISAP